MIYHICRRGEAEKAFAAGFYAPDSLQTEGFIHFSTAAQVVGVANVFTISNDCNFIDFDIFFRFIISYSFSISNCIDYF